MTFNRHRHLPTASRSRAALGAALILCCSASISLAQAPEGASGPSRNPGNASAPGAGGAASGPPGAASGPPGAASGSPGAASGPGAAASAPPVSVTLVRAQQRPFKISIDASGSVSAASNVDVRPQVSTLVTQVHVKEGQFVTKGQLLFTLDARADQAALQRAEAQLLRDEATLVDARRQLARNQDLLRQNFISQGAVDTSAANVLAQEAGVAADKAVIESVRVTLSYSKIAAAGAGRIGTIAVFPGSSVSPQGAVLTTVTQIDPISVTFNLPQRHLEDALKALATPAGAAANVTATLPDNKGERVGKLSFVDSLIDPASGTVKVKASFDNKDRALWPGAYVNVKLALQTLADAIVIPQASIVQTARGTIVFAAGQGNAAVVRPIKVVASEGTDAVVSGLKPGDRIVLEGRQNVRPGVTLIDRPREAGAPGGARPGAPGGPGGPGGGASGPRGPRPEGGGDAAAAAMGRPASAGQRPDGAASTGRRPDGAASGSRRPDVAASAGRRTSGN